MTLEKVLFLLCACVIGVSIKARALDNPSTLVSGAVPRAGHVFVVVEENHGLSAVMNGGMPYLISLANQYAQATQYYGDTHPSIGNYMMMTTGQIFTNND